MTADQQQRLVDNIARTMKGVPKEIALRQIGHFSKADKAYGDGVAQRLGLDASTGVAAQ